MPSSYVFASTSPRTSVYITRTPNRVSTKTDACRICSKKRENNRQPRPSSASPRGESILIGKDGPRAFAILLVNPIIPRGSPSVLDRSRYHDLSLHTTFTAIAYCLRAL